MNQINCHNEEDPFKRLREMQSGLWHKGHEKINEEDKQIFSVLEIIAGSVCDCITKALNNTHIENQDTFLNLYEKKNRGGKGLLTASNHTHYIDDPLLIAAMMNYKYWNSIKILTGDDSEFQNFKWTPAAKENFFFNTDLAAWFFGRTKTVPVQRGLRSKQESWIHLGEFLKQGDYVHVFGEATRTRNLHVLGQFKTGIGQLVYHAPDTIILPWGHDGIQNALPYGCAPEVYKNLNFNHLNPLSHFINPGSRIQIVVGEPFSLKNMAEDLPPENSTYAAISNAVRERVKPCFDRAIELNQAAA